MISNEVVDAVLRTTIVFFMFAPWAVLFLWGWAIQRSAQMYAKKLEDETGRKVRPFDGGD